MIKGACHCGAIEFEVIEPPNYLVSCNCSICKRLAALWAHVETRQVTIQQKEKGTISYIHGDRTLAFHTCKKCGCTTHWQSLKPDELSRMAVNFRMCSNAVIEKFNIRQFDGAKTWEFID
jgi:hypothetical protein